METTLLLNIYRTSIASDSDGLRILSLLLREGSKNYDEISEVLSVPIEKVKKKISELYQASLIKLVEHETLVLTELGKSILIKLGIRDVAVKSFISSKEIPEWQDAFLKACIETMTSKDFSREQHYFNLLRSLNITESLLSWWSKDIKNLEQQLRFILVAGLDAELFDMEGEFYCNKVLEWHEKKSTDLWKEMGVSMLKHKNALIQSCVDALANVKTCKKILFYDKEVESEGTANIPLRLLYLMILSALLHEQSERDLKTAYWFTESVVEKTWTKLSKLKHNIENDTVTILCQQLAEIYSEEISEDVSRNRKMLVQRLKGILEEQVEPSKDYSEKIHPFINDIIYRRQFGNKQEAQYSSVISVDNEILSGTPVFKNTRVPIKNLLDYLEGGYDIDEFLDHFPSVKREQVIKFLEVSGMEYLLNHYQ